MASTNHELWQSILFLFLSKFVKQAQTPFAKKDLINAKNVELANKFAQMTGNTTPPEKMKNTLNKALAALQKKGLVEEVDVKTLQLTNAGWNTMHIEVKAAMTKISQEFPQSQTANAPKAN
ncbi:hypothetical protein [uncultured Desulfuromonas sp.]|uniref:hypothetical protein n=1 Tax=uncultured Desulfuromonas sp. TaxID=181013 RepID=UPI002AAAA01D|nr:hypothetical protein [uncultured Desulfuromonas sp.]